MFKQLHTFWKLNYRELSTHGKGLIGKMISMNKIVFRFFSLIINLNQNFKKEPQNIFFSKNEDPAIQSQVWIRNLKCLKVGFYSNRLYYILTESLSNVLMRVVVNIVVFFFLGRALIPIFSYINICTPRVIPGLSALHWFVWTSCLSGLHLFVWTSFVCLDFICWSELLVCHSAHTVYCYIRQSLRLNVMYINRYSYRN